MREILLNRCNPFITPKTILGVMILLVSFIKYRRPRILKYNFDWSRQELSMRSQLMFSNSLRIFLMILMSWLEATWLVVMIIDDFSICIKSTIIFELASLSDLLIELMWKFVLLPMILTLSLLLKMITCFLEGSFVVILVLGLTIPDLLIMFISTIFLGNMVRNMSLIWIISSTLIFEAYVYDLLLLFVLWQPLVTKTNDYTASKSLK